MIPVFSDFLFPSEYSLLFSQMPPELPVANKCEREKRLLSRAFKQLHKRYNIKCYYRCLCCKKYIISYKQHNFSVPSKTQKFKVKLKKKKKSQTGSRPHKYASKDPLDLRYKLITSMTKLAAFSMRLTLLFRSTWFYGSGITEAALYDVSRYSRFYLNTNSVQPKWELELNLQNLLQGVTHILSFHRKQFSLTPSHHFINWWWNGVLFRWMDLE